MDYKHVLDHTKPAQKYFEEISRIPHNSNEEKAISDYIVTFAKAHGLWCHQDELWNVIVKKPASPGYEDAPSVMLQGHMDMVCVKTEESTHDFAKDPLELYVENCILHARGTSLGADDGVGVAYMLAVLEDDSIKHPALECVFTVQEETGMYGAKGIDGTLLSARRMIGLDAAGETSSFVACYCSDRIEIVKALTFEEVRGQICAFKISGLETINPGECVHQEAGNGIKMMGRLLYRLLSEGIAINLCGLEGGIAENHNPRECIASFVCDKALMEKAKTILQQELQLLDNEFDKAGHPARLDFTEVPDVKGMLPAKASEEIINLIYLLPNNVFQWSFHLKEMMSVNNIGLISLDEEKLYILMSTRSRVESSAIQLQKHCEALASVYADTVVVTSRYRPWAYNPDSYMRKLTNRILQQKWGKQLEEMVCCGGLEMAVFADKLPGLDVVMIGPIYMDMHKTSEWLDLESFDRVYEILLLILEELKEME